MMHSSLDTGRQLDQAAQTADTGSPSAVPLLLIIAYLIAKPFYFQDSGSAQIGDLIFALVFGITVLGRQELARGTAPVLWMALLFATYSLIVNAVWAGILDDLSILKTPVFYFFNCAVIYVLLVTSARSGERFLRAVLYGVALSAILQVLLSLAFIAGGQERQTLFFNNPNQLGYWAVLSATMFCMLAKRLRVRLIFQLPMLAIFGYVVALSLSKGAIIAFLTLGLIHFSRKWSHMAMLVLICVPIVYLASDLPLIEDVVGRLENIGHQSDDSLHGRGYDRIWLYPRYLFFGAGELGLVRFPETHIELHSTLGTVVFSYGAIGVLLFGLLLWQLLRVSNWSLMLYLVPAFLYGLAHQGLRFSLLWVLFAMIAAVGASAESGNPETSAAAGGATQPGRHHKTTRRLGN